MTTEVRKTVHQYLLLKTISAFAISFIAAIYASFLIAKGLNLFQVNLVNFAFYTVLFIFEIPTGAFADVFGRKLSYLISCFLFAAGMFAYGLAGSFWGFVGAEVLCAVGATFASGAFQAWLVDRLKSQGHAGPLTAVFATEQKLKGIVSIAAAIMGAYLAQKNLSLPWFAGGGLMLAVGILALFWMKETEFVRETFSFTQGLASMKKVVQSSSGYMAANPAVRFIFLMGLAQAFAVQAANMQWQPFFGRFLADKTWFGLIFAAIALAMMLGSHIAPRFLRTVPDKRLALSLAQIGIGLGICLTPFFGLIPALCVFLVHEIARGLYVPIDTEYLNENIPSDERATLLSFDAMAGHLGGMLGLVISGAVAEYISLESAWLVSGLTLIASTLFLLKNTKRTF